MSFDRLTARGAGKLAWRASVEGWPVDFVSHRDMVQPIKKDGLTGWSASNYLSGVGLLPGSSTMTISRLFQYNGGTGLTLLEHQGGSGGYIIDIDGSSRARLTLYESGVGTTSITSAALSSGTVYVLTVSYDGTNMRMVLGQTASTPVAAGFTVASTTTALGALAGGASPAAGIVDLGLAQTESRALSDAQMQAHNARVSALGEMVNLLDGEHLYKAPDLSTDLVGSADWTVNGRLRVATVDAVTGLYGRKRIAGLRSDGFEFREKVDPVTAEWDPSGFNVVISGGARQKNNPAAQAFKGPSNRTFLTSNATAAATTIEVVSTAGFPDSGVIHVDTEAIYYVSKNSTQFTGCVRGVWGSEAQAHYVTDGTENDRQPEVTDFPQVLEGRRVKLYAYGAGDDKQGDGGNSGDPIWFGVAATGARFDGLSWSFMVDGPNRLFDVDFGADFGDGLPIRGIYYSDWAPLYIQIAETADTNVTWTSTTTAVTWVRMSGFWESQEAFCSALTTNLVDALTNHPLAGTFTQTDVKAVPWGDSWAIEFTTDGVTPHGMAFVGPREDDDHISPVDGRFAQRPFEKGDHDESQVVIVSAGTTYVYQLTSGGSDLERPGSVPRTTSFVRQRMIDARIPSDNVYRLSGTNWPEGRLYLGGSQPLTSALVEQVVIEWSSNGIGKSMEDRAAAGFTTSFNVEASDSTNRYVEVSTGLVLADIPHVATAANVPALKFGLKITTGTLANFLDGLTDLWADNINRGSVPNLRNSDIDLTGDSLSSIETAAASTPYTASRRFIFFTEQALGDVITEECKLLGVHPAMGSNGKIVFKRLRVPALSEVAGNTITTTDILTDDGFLAYEQGQYALWNRVVYSTRFAPLEDEHVGETVTVRDMDAFAISPRAKSLSVAPLSEDPSGPIDHADLRKLAGRVLGTYGAPYSVLTVAVPISKWSVSVGDVVGVTWSKIPDNLGDLGVTGKLGYVVSREWRPMEGRGVFEILLHDQRVGGYVPSATVASQSGSGTTWDITLNASGYFPTGTSAEDWFGVSNNVGDSIRLYKWDNTSAGTITGTVTTVAGNVVSVLLDSTWTPGADTWVLSGAVSTSISKASQKVYVYIARTDRLVHWASSETVSPFTMAP